MALVALTRRTLCRLTRTSATTTCKARHCSHDSKATEDMDDLVKNPYYSKYAGKIAEMQKTSPEEFMKRLDQTQAALKKSKKSEAVEKGRDFSLPTQPKNDVAGGSIPSMVKEKGLADIMKTELLWGKTAEEIGEIWRQHHASKDTVCAIVPADVFVEMRQRFREYSTFLFPLPRKQGYEFFVVQFSGNEAHFTTLINYQAHSANAPECMTIVHYNELADDKGIVLMVGDYDNNVLDTQEAQCLANQVEMYYCRPSKEKLRLMETFSKTPAEFRHMDLIAQLENVDLLTESRSQQKQA